MIKIFNIRPKIAFDIQFSDQFGLLNIVQEISHNGNLADKLIANFENKSRIIAAANGNGMVNYHKSPFLSSFFCNIGPRL